MFLQLGFCLLIALCSCAIPYFIDLYLFVIVHSRGHMQVEYLFYVLSANSWLSGKSSFCVEAQS